MTCNDIVYCPNHLYSNVLDTKLYTCVLIQVADEYRYTFLRNDVIYLGLPSYKKKRNTTRKKSKFGNESDFGAHIKDITEI